MDHQEDNKLTDQALVAKVLRGDTKAFRFIIKNTEGLVAQIIFKMISNPEDRKDISQDVYLKAFKKLNSFKFQAKLSTWIGQITYNTCLNYLEKKRLSLFNSTATEQETDDTIEKLLSKKLDPFENDIERHLLNKELAQILTIEIDKLPPIYKTLITLYHNEELSCAEIAEIVQFPEGTVKNYLFRARKMLKDLLLITYNKGIL